jgi:hypothetical protein
MLKLADMLGSKLITLVLQLGLQGRALLLDRPTELLGGLLELIDEQLQSSAALLCPAEVQFLALADGTLGLYLQLDLGGLRLELGQPRAQHVSALLRLLPDRSGALLEVARGAEPLLDLYACLLERSLTAIQIRFTVGQLLLVVPDRYSLGHGGMLRLGQFPAHLLELVG